MTINDRANQPDDGGSQTVDSSNIDNPDNLNFWEPGDDEDVETQANPKDGVEGIEGEPDEVDETIDQETDASADDETDADAETGDEGEKPEADKALDETLVTLKGGEQVPVKELKSGYMRERDYRIKTQDVANERRSLDQMSNRVADAAMAIAKFLADQLPPEPSTELAITNPSKFTQEKAIFDAAFGQIGKIMELAAPAKSTAAQMSTEERRNMLAKENTALEARFPETKTDEGREKFFDGAFNTARQLGFTEAELQGNVDHRYFALAHYARLGMQAEAAKKRAMTKVNNAPAAAPKGKAQGQNATAARKNNDAMARLARTGSIHDAVRIDFD